MIAIRHIAPTLIVIFWLIPVGGFAQTHNPGRQALKDVKSGWTQELLYEQVLVSPQALCYDSSHNLYIYEYSRNMLYRMDAGGELSDVTSTETVALRTIAWQPGKKRLVGFDSHGMYELLPRGFRKLKDLDRSFLVSTVAIDPTDDSIFAGHDTKGRPIVHLDADGRLIEILRKNVQGCSQLAFDDRRSILYFSETFSGSISSLDLSTKRVDVLVRDIGIPGTEEPVMIWLDGKYTLWFSTANDGIYRYGNGGFQQIAPPTMGAGPVVWSPLYDNLVAIQYVGSNLVTYDFQHKEAVDITPHLNAFDIVEDSSGRVFYPRYEFIFMLSEGKIVRFSEQLPDVCLGIEIDQQGRLYAALRDGDIYQITPSGKAKLWKTRWGAFAALDYDRVNDSIVLATRRGGIVSIYRIPTTAPGKTIRIASMTEEGGATMKRLASDNSGRIYLYDWGSNDILLVDEPNMELKILFTDILASRAITVPGFEYSVIEDALIIGTLEYYYAIDRDLGKQETLAMNKHGADNFAIHENPDGSLLFIHSGQIFKLNPR